MKLKITKHYWSHRTEKMYWTFLSTQYFLGLMLATLVTESLVGFRNVRQLCKRALGMENWKSGFFK